MPTYILLTKLTADGLQTLHNSPRRLFAVNQEIKALGCKLVAQYALLGQWDFLNIIEAPDNETMAHLSIDLGARGTASHLTMAALTPDELLPQLTGGVHLA